MSHWKFQKQGKVGVVTDDNRKDHVVHSKEEGYWALRSLEPHDSHEWHVANDALLHSSLPDRIGQTDKNGWSIEIHGDIMVVMDENGIEYAVWSKLQGSRILFGHSDEVGKRFARAMCGGFHDLSELLSHGSGTTMTENQTMSWSVVVDALLSSSHIPAWIPE